MRDSKNRIQRREFDRKKRGNGIFSGIVEPTHVNADVYVVVDVNVGDVDAKVVHVVDDVNVVDVDKEAEEKYHSLFWKQFLIVLFGSQGSQHRLLYEIEGRS